MPMTELTNVSSAYGAPMGRRDERGDPDAPYKLYLRRVPMVDGDYDSGGAYWGGGFGVEPLWRYESTCGEASGFLRARSREHARAMVRETYPKARFYR
jgi:hypothetical protein